MVNWMIPADESVLEVTIGYEQLAVDLTAYLALTEPDSYIRQALEFALIEDFDHLYRYANLLELLEGKKAETIVKNLTEITPGRPTVAEHRHPLDELRKHYDKNKAALLTKLHVATIVAAEQQTMNYYMTVGNRLPNMTGRGLYAEIGMMEEQHVSHYESLADPTASWFEMLYLHEYNECYVYYSCMATEVDERVKKVWESHLMQELEHLRLAGELMKKYEKKDPASLFKGELPEPITLQPNKEYVRKVIASQLELTALDTEFVPVNKLPADSRYAWLPIRFDDERIVVEWLDEWDLEML